MFLSESEIEKLTGRKQPGLQLRFLQENHVPHCQDAQGRAVVMRDAVLEFMLGKTPGRKSEAPGPSWDLLE